MADDFDPDAHLKSHGIDPAAPSAGAEMTYEQKVMALRQKMAADAEAAKHPQASPLPPWMAAPVGAASAMIPGAAGVAGGVGAMMAGRPFGQGYKMGTQSQNSLLAGHPVMGTLGAIGGAMVSPLAKAAGALTGGISEVSPLLQHVASNGIQGAAMGAGMGTDARSASVDGATGFLTGIGTTLAGAGISQGLKSLGGKLGGARDRLIDYFASKGANKIAENPELSVLGNDSNAIGAPGPKSVPELQTSEWLRTPAEKELARTSAKALPIVSRSRPEAAIVQTMGPEYAKAPIGDMVTNYKAGQPLYKALNRIGQMGGADVSGNQLQQNIQRTMAAKQLGPQSPLSSLFESATGQDLGEAARRVANTADENLFYSPNAHNAGATQMEQGANRYLGDLGDNMANRHGGGYVPKPKFSPGAGKATVAEGNGNVTANVDMNAPVSEASPDMQPHSSFLNAGQPSSKIQYSPYSPQEAADIGGAAERTNAINLGRNSAGSLADMMKRFGGHPITGNIPGLGAAARVGGAMGPGAAEVAAGAASKVGQGVKGLGNIMSQYIPPEQVTAAFLTSNLPKNDLNDDLVSQ